MSDKYNINSSQFFEAIRNYEKGFFYGVGAQELSQALNDNNASLGNYLYYNSLRANMNYAGTRNEGSSMDQVLASSQVLTGLNIANLFMNSNADVTSTGKVSLVKGATKAAAGSTAGSFTLSPVTASTATSVLLCEIPAAIAAVGTGIQLGTAIDGVAYNIMSALDEHPPYELNPANWANITKEDNSLGMQTLRYLCGINTDDETVQGYITQDAFANLAFWEYSQGWYDDSYNAEDSVTPEQKEIIDPANRIFNPIHLTNNLIITDVGDPPTVSQLVCNSDIGMWITELSNSDSPVLPFPEAGPRRVWAVGTRPFTVTLSVNGGAPSQQNSVQGTFHDNITGELVTFYYINEISTGQTRAMKTSSLPYRINRTHNNLNTINQLVMQYYLHGTYVPTGDRPEGISTQPGATIPETRTWTDPQSTLISLQNQYPDLFSPTEMAIEVPTLQPDGSIENILYVPIGFGQPVIINDNSSRVYTISSPDGSVQNDTKVDTTTADTALTNELLKCILNQINSLDPAISLEANFILPEEEEEEEEEDEPKPEEVIQTGVGRTTPQVKQITVPCSLFRVYNPTDYSVDAFGNWLWDSSVIGVIKNLITDPLQAVLSLHKIYVQPTVTTHSNITVAKLDSNITSGVVDDVYTEFDFGSVTLAERFGNVFDYSPYTSVQIYLPFVGIVPLNVADVMRGTLNLIYRVDVSTGTFVADLSVTRDTFPELNSESLLYDQVAAGGSIYQFNGNMAVQYPVSGADYRNLYSSLIGAAGLALGAVGGAVAAYGAGIAGTSANMKAPRAFMNTGAHMLKSDMIQIKRSGSLSGNFGALGNKEAYLIITHPQVAMDAQDDVFHGVPSNEIVTLSECSGFVTVKEVRLKLQGATHEEYTECETLLKNGVIF